MYLASSLVAGVADGVVVASLKMALALVKAAQSITLSLTMDLHFLQEFISAELRVRRSCECDTITSASASSVNRAMQVRRWWLALAEKSLYVRPTPIPPRAEIKRRTSIHAHDIHHDHDLRTRAILPLYAKAELQ